MNVTKHYAVVLYKDGEESLCSTFNATHDAWMPAIFNNEEDADGYMTTISNVKGYENNSYCIREIVSVWGENHG